MWVSSPASGKQLQLSAPPPPPFFLGKKLYSRFSNCCTYSQIPGVSCVVCLDIFKYFDNIWHFAMLRANQLDKIKLKFVI